MGVLSLVKSLTERFDEETFKEILRKKFKSFEEEEIRLIPEWEQELSAGAACQNLLLAAQGMGLAAQWRSAWPAYDEEVLRFLGLAENERVAGFFYIGRRRADSPPLTDRRRPYWEDLTRFFGEDGGSTE